MYQNETKQSHWFIFPKPNENAKLRIFCFPYAGSGASIYKKWEDMMPMEVELCAVQLPGRENRKDESAITNFSSLIEVLISEIMPLLDKPFVFFGHSMGALISFELAKRFEEMNCDLPIYLILSGFSPIRDRQFNLPMNDEDFVNLLRRLNGTPTEILDNKEVLSHFLPVIKADFELLNSYASDSNTPLECPIIAYGGEDDPSSMGIKGWEDYTTKTFKVKMFEGDHFFINWARDEVLAALRMDLRAMVSEVNEMEEMEFLDNFINREKSEKALKKGSFRGEKQRVSAENIKKMKRV